MEKRAGAAGCGRGNRPSRGNSHVFLDFSCKNIHREQDFSCKNIHRELGGRLGLEKPHKGRGEGLLGLVVDEPL